MSVAALLAAMTLSGQTVVLDPGHNGRNGSAPSTINRQVDIGNGRKACDTTGTAGEAGFTWDVARRTRAILRERGATVVLTRRSNRGVGPCITQRAAIGNRARAGAAISIHADGGPAGGRGFHVIAPKRLRGLTDDIATPSLALARDVRRAYRGRTGLPYSTYLGVRGLDVRGDLGGLNLSDVPKVFLEAGNMRNARDRALLRSPTFRGRIARGIADGVQRFLQRRG